MGTENRKAFTAVQLGLLDDRRFVLEERTSELTGSVCFEVRYLICEFMPYEIQCKRRVRGAILARFPLLGQGLDQRINHFHFWFRDVVR
jgi:hypothetical protein